MIAYPIPVIGFSAFSGTGKTTLLTRVLPILRERGLRFGVIKHAHHQFEIDHPEKDSSKLRYAGADKLLICSKHRRALIEELDETSPEPTLDTALAGLSPENLDVVLVEGFKNASFPKIELHRQELRHKPRFPKDADIVAIVSNASAASLGINDIHRSVTHLPLDQPERIATFVTNFVQQQKTMVLDPSQSVQHG